VGRGGRKVGEGKEGTGRGEKEGQKGSVRQPM